LPLSVKSERGRKEYLLVGLVRQPRRGGVSSITDGQGVPER